MVAAIAMLSQGRRWTSALGPVYMGFALGAHGEVGAPATVVAEALVGSERESSGLQRTP